jgi:hypothetical protein
MKLLFLLIITVYCNYNFYYKDNHIIFKLINYTQEIIVYDDNIYSKYSIDNKITNIDKPGYPDLPIIRKGLIGNDLKYEIIKIKKNIMKTNKIISIKEQKNRCSRKNFNYTFANIYNQEIKYPNKYINIYNFFKEKEINGYIFELNPIIYDIKNNKIEIIKYLKIKLIDNDKIIKITKSDFDIYKFIYINFNYYKYRVLEDSILIITIDKYFKSAEKLYKHKIEQNIKQIELIKSSQTSSIKQYIIKSYHEKNTKYVIFIGNHKDIPLLWSRETNTLSDSSYGILYNNTNNIYISRISGNNSYDIENQIDKIISYEINDKYKKNNFLGIASMDGNPDDCFFMKLLHQMIKNSRNESIYNFNILCEPYANKEELINLINIGVHFINYLGHGSGKSWLTTHFNTSDAFNIKNAIINPIIIDISCTNGDIELNPCLAESFMHPKKYKSGSLSMYSSIPLADWVPPIYLQYFSYYILQYNQNPISIGQMAYSGTMMACIMFPNNCNKMAFGYMLYGDSSVLIHKF